MKSLYENGLEHLYDVMYQSFIDYKEEFEFYSGIIKMHRKKSVLEIGCGSGNLAKYFIGSTVDYSGLDISHDMINLSKKRNPSGQFMQGDVTNYRLHESTDAVIITGRTTSYLLSNYEVLSALDCIKENMNTGGLLCFDFIDAKRFFKEIEGGIDLIHEVQANSRHFLRISSLKLNRKLENYMFDWKAVYFEKIGDDKIELARDDSTVRAFTKSEWKKLLKSCGFNLVEFIDKRAYMFDTYVVVAQKTVNPPDA